MQSFLKNAFPIMLIGKTHLPVLSSTLQSSTTAKPLNCYFRTQLKLQFSLNSFFQNVLLVGSPDDGSAARLYTIWLCLCNVRMWLHLRRCNGAEPWPPYHQIFLLSVLFACSFCAWCRSNVLQRQSNLLSVNGRCFFSHWLIAMR